MQEDNQPTKGKGKIPEVRFRCNLLLCNPSSVFFRVQSTFANNIQDWGISETIIGDSHSLICFDREFCIPFIVGYDHDQRVRITLFGGDELKVGKGYPLGYCELSLMELGGQPSNVPILMQGEAVIAHMTFICNIQKIRQDFDLTSMDPISSLGFSHSAPTLTKLRAKKKSFVENRTSFSLELFGKDLFCAQVPESKSKKHKAPSLQFVDSESPSSLDDPPTIINKFFSMVKTKKLQFSIRVYVTHDPVSEEMFFYDDIELEELDTWKMIYATCRVDFFKPSIHEHSPEISEDVLIGESGWQNHTNWTAAFVILLHYTTKTGQEGIQPMSVRIENLCSYMQNLQEYLIEKKEELRQKGEAQLQQVLQRHDSMSPQETSSALVASSKKQPEAVKIVFGDRSASTSRFNELTFTLLQSTMRSIASSTADAPSPVYSSSPLMKRSSTMHRLRSMRRLSRHKLGMHEEPTMLTSQSNLNTHDNDPNAEFPACEGSESTVDEFTQTLHAFITIIRKTMVHPLSFQMYARQDLQIVVAGPKYEEKIHALFHRCYEDWLKKMTLPFQYAMKMFQDASDNAYELLYLQSYGQQLEPVVLIDMFHPCLQQTLNQHLLSKYRQNHHSSSHAALNNAGKLSISRHSCHVLHALLTFYETLFPLFPQGRNLRILAGGNIRTPKINPEMCETLSDSLVSPVQGWFHSLMPNIGVSTDIRGINKATEDDEDDAETTCHSQYVRKKGYPYIAELLMAQATTELKLKLIKDKKKHKETTDRMTYPLQTTLCMCDTSTSISQVEDDHEDDIESKAAKEEKFEDNLLQLQMWQREVSRRGDGTTLHLTEDRYKEYANEVFYGDAKDLVRGFMEATEAYIPVTDVHSHQYISNCSTNNRLSRGTQISSNSQKNSSKTNMNSTDNTASNSNYNNNNRSAVDAGTDRRNRRRRLALYTGTDYDPDLTYEDILDSQVDLVPCIGKNHDFAALRMLLASKEKERRQVHIHEKDHQAMVAQTVSSAIVTPVVWILGRSPPLRNKFNSDITQNILKNRVEELCFKDFPLHRDDKCLIIVLAAEHRYDFPILDKHGQLVQELRAIAHPFEEFHRILGQVLQQRRRDYLVKKKRFELKNNASPPPNKVNNPLSSSSSPEEEPMPFVPENIFVIHQYAFSEVLARALEYEILNDPSLHSSHRWSSSNTLPRRSSPRHHRLLSPQHRASETDTSASATSSALPYHHHKLPRLSSIKAILTTIFSQGPNTVDVHIIDEILSTGEEILDRHVRRAEKTEDIERKLVENIVYARNASVMNMVTEPEMLALQAVKEVRNRASTLVKGIRRVSVSRFTRRGSALSEDGSDDEKISNKNDVIRDFAHLTAIKERFDAAILQLVRRQYHHIATSILRCPSMSKTTSSRKPVSIVSKTSKLSKRVLQDANDNAAVDSSGSGFEPFSWISPVLGSSTPPPVPEDTSAAFPPWGLSWMPFLTSANPPSQPVKKEVPINKQSSSADVKIRPPPLTVPSPLPFEDERKKEQQDKDKENASAGKKKSGIWKNVRNSFMLLKKETNDPPSNSNMMIQ